MKRTRSALRARMTGMLGGTSGGLGLFGSAHNVCHALCQGTIAFLAIFGVYVAVDGPFMFLRTYSTYFWGMAVAFLVIGIFMYKKKCMSDKVIIFNAGLVIAGLPFASAQGFSVPLWAGGGLLVSLSIFLFIKDRIGKGKSKKCCRGKKNEK